MQKVSGITTFIIVGLLVLGSCASPVTKVDSSPLQKPASLTPQVNAPATASVQSPVAAPVVNPPSAPTPVSVQTSVTGAAFTTSNLKITPGKVSPGSEVTVTASIKNIGTQAGTVSVVMDMKGDDEACPMISPIAKDVTLAAGAAQDVIFNILMPKGFGGGFTVTIGSEKGALIVE